MIHLNLDPTFVPKGEVVALTPEASVLSLGEIKVGRRKFQIRRTTDLATGTSTDYLVGPKPVSFATMGPAYYLEAADADTLVATSRETGNALKTGRDPVRFRWVDDILILA